MRFCFTICALLLGCLAGCGPEEKASTKGVASSAIHLPKTAGEPMPLLLSQTGVFEEVGSLKPAVWLVPYDLNVAFWSDGAAKRRWICVSQGEKVGFAPTGEWTFPAGTFFVKHFEMPAENGAPPKRLETRILICDSKGGVFGASYKWRADGSDADLVTDAIADGQWYYPKPADCQVCHTAAAGGVLGVKTRQLNREFGYSGGSVRNQLVEWSARGLLDHPVDAQAMEKMPKLARAEAPVPLEDRARSYLDANCSHCHRPGGSPGNFDARYDTPLEKQNLINGSVLIDLGLDRARVIAPKDVWRSVALARVETLEQTKMPPLAHQRIDRSGAELLRAWIESLPGQEVLAPVQIEPKGGEFKQAVRVTLRHPKADATIHYTLDGSVPQVSSPVYRGPIEVGEPATLRARAFKDGYMRSVTVQETFVVGN